LEKLKDLYPKYACVNPADKRKSYEIMRDFIESRISEINERKEYIKKCVNDLEECNKPLGEMEKVLKKIGKTSNRGMMGTLHGLCKKTIEEKKISMDEIEKMVFDFHDEAYEIEKSRKKSASRGGMFSKRNNTKRKTYRAKNGNNKSKKRRFK
jgi:hypothetical protein